MTALYAWEVQRGESAGLLCPVVDADGDLVDPTAWPTTAAIFTEPGGSPVLPLLEGVGMRKSPEGVHLSLTAVQTSAVQWRRAWFEVVVTDPNNPTEVSMIVHGPVTVTDS